MPPGNTMNNQRPRFGPSFLPDRRNYSHVDMNQNHSATLSRSSRRFSGSVTGSSFTTDEPELQDPSASSQFGMFDQGSHEDPAASEAPILTQLGSWQILENELPGTLDLGDGHNPGHPPPSDESAMTFMAQSLGTRSMPPHLKEMFNALGRIQGTYQLIGLGEEPTQDQLILSRQFARRIAEDLTSRIQLENKPSGGLLSEVSATDGPFRCSLCPRETKYKSRHTLIRHFHEKHNHRWCYHCPERCGYSAYRRDKTHNHVFKKHLRSPGTDELDKNRDGLELPHVCSVCKTIPRAWETMEKCYIDSCRMPSASSDGSSQQEGHGYGAGPRHPMSSTLAFSTPSVIGSTVGGDNSLYDSDMDLSQVGVSFQEVENDQMDTSMDASMHAPVGNSMSTSMNCDPMGSCERAQPAMLLHPPRDVSTLERRHSDTTQHHHYDYHPRGHEHVDRVRRRNQEFHRQEQPWHSTNTAPRHDQIQEPDRHKCQRCGHDFGSCQFCHARRSSQLSCHMCSDNSAIQIDQSVRYEENLGPSPGYRPPYVNPVYINQFRPQSGGLAFGGVQDEGYTGDYMQTFSGGHFMGGNNYWRIGVLADDDSSPSLLGIYGPTMIGSRPIKMPAIPLPSAIAQPLAALGALPICDGFPKSNDGLTVSIKSSLDKSLALDSHYMPCGINFTTGKRTKGITKMPWDPSSSHLLRKWAAVDVRLLHLEHSFSEILDNHDQYATNGFKKALKSTVGLSPKDSQGMVPIDLTESDLIPAFSKDSSGSDDMRLPLPSPQILIAPICGSGLRIQTAKLDSSLSSPPTPSPLCELNLLSSSKLLLLDGIEQLLRREGHETKEHKYQVVEFCHELELSYPLSKQSKQSKQSNCTCALAEEACFCQFADTARDVNSAPAGFSFSYLAGLLECLFVYLICALMFLLHSPTLGSCPNKFYRFGP